MKDFCFPYPPISPRSTSVGLALVVAALVHVFPAFAAELDQPEEALIVISGETSSGKRVTVHLRHFSYGSSNPLVFASITIQSPSGGRVVKHFLEAEMFLPEGWSSQMVGEDLTGIENCAWDNFSKDGAEHLILVLDSSAAMVPEAELRVRFLGPIDSGNGIKNGINRLYFSWPDRDLKLELSELTATFAEDF